MYLKINENSKIIEHYKGASIIMIKNNQVISKDCNETGRQILKLCDGTNTFDDIINVLEMDYGILTNQQKESVKVFLDEYLKDQIISFSSNPVPVKLKIVGKPDIVVPTHLSIELTNLCQLKCIHCFNSSGLARENEISIEEIIRVSNFFLEIGTSTFFLTGGEPLLKKGIENLLVFLGKRALSVTLATNGFNLKNSVLDILKQYPNIGVQISLDGLEKNHDFIRGVKGAFNKTINNIKKLTENGISVSISYTMNDFNKDDIDGLIELCKNIGCIGVSIGLTSNAGRAKENQIPTKIAKSFANILANSHKKYTTEDFQVGLDICEKKLEVIINSIEYPNKCGAGYKELHIMSDGRITPCPAIPQLVMGNVKNDDLYEIIKIENIKKIMNIPSPVREKCGNCVHYERCGNCIASMLEVNKNECIIQQNII